MTIEELQAELASAKARITALNEEAAGHRLNAKTAREALEAAAAKHGAELTAFGEKLTAAEKAAKDAGESRINVLRDAALKLAAKDAGIVDLDGLKLLDTSKVTVGDDGDVKIPEKFFEAAKEAKPYLFKLAGKDTGTTSSTHKAPSAQEPAAKHARDMTDAEQAARLAELTKF